MRRHAVPMHNTFEHSSPRALSTLGQAVADGRIRVKLRSQTQPAIITTEFKTTAAGGCFKQGASGKFVKKVSSNSVAVPTRDRSQPARYQPDLEHGRQSLADSRSFRPKQTVADCKRSITQLQRSLHEQREDDEQHRLQQSALQAQVNSIELIPAQKRIKQLLTNLQAEKAAKEASQETAKRLRRERNVARSELFVAESAMTAQHISHEGKLAEVAFQQDVEMQEFKASVQQQADAAIKDAYNDKDDGIAKAKAQAQQYRQHWTKAHIQKSRLQLKLKGTVEHFETKATNVKTRNKKDVNGLLTELQVLVKSSECDRDRSNAQQSKLNAAISGMQGQLSQATGPIETMKNSRDFSDEIVLLSWELMAMGVSANIVEDVEALCCEHLAHRKLKRKPSKSTSARWSIQSKDIAIHHLGEMLSKNAERGIGCATDTTTVRSAERAANNFEIRLTDGTVLKLRGPVNELASHTADGRADKVQCRIHSVGHAPSVEDCWYPREC